MPDLEPHFARFVPLYRPAFKIVEAEFLRSLEQGDTRCPAIKVEMAIDKREIRPEKIDEW